MSKLELRQSTNTVKEDVTSLLQQFESHINWSTTPNAAALDVGCGDGIITAEAVKVLIPKTMKLEACDSSQEVLEIAKNQYGDRGITYFPWDVASNIPEGFHEKYDHVVSFHCFEYIKDQRTALKNIYKLLKPGGNCFILQSPKLTFYECIRKLSKYPIYASYLTDVTEKCKVSLEEVKDPEKTFKDMMSSAGFQSLEIKKEKRCDKFNSWNELEDLAICIDPYQRTLPYPMRRDYMGNFLEELSDYVEEHLDQTGNITSLTCAKEVLIAYGKKLA